jgi:hypothetical protein
MRSPRPLRDSYFVRRNHRCGALEGRVESTGIRTSGGRSRCGLRCFKIMNVVAGVTISGGALGRVHGRQSLCPVCLPITPGFSPASRRLMTASIPWASICSPKSVR